MLKPFQIGGATGLIGDPSGRKSERSQLHMDVVSKNLESIQKQLVNIFQNHQECLWDEKKSKFKLKNLR